MSIDKDKLANDILKDQDITSLLANKQMLMSLLSGPEGKKLISILSRDGGKALKQAADALAKGDSEKAKDAIMPMIDDEGAQILNSLNNKAKG